jgi:hypothetical protein
VRALLTVISLYLALLSTFSSTGHCCRCVFLAATLSSPLSLLEALQRHLLAVLSFDSSKLIVLIPAC